METVCNANGSVSPAVYVIFIKIKEGMKDYRTFKEDFLKLVEFAEWYKDYIA